MSRKPTAAAMRYRQKFPRFVLNTLPLIVTFLTVLCPPHVAGGGSATFQGIGDLPGGGFFSTAFGVSPDGSTVVGSSLSSADPDSFLSLGCVTMETWTYPAFCMQISMRSMQR